MEGEKEKAEGDRRDTRRGRKGGRKRTGRATKEGRAGGEMETRKEIPPGTLPRHEEREKRNVRKETMKTVRRGRYSAR